MLEFIKEHFLILCLLAAIITIGLNIVLKRKGIKIEPREGPSKDNALDRALDEGREAATNPAFAHLIGNIYNKNKKNKE